MNWIVRDGLELLIVVAIGGILVSALLRMRKGEIKVHHCASCHAAISRMYAACPKCGSAQSNA